MMINNYFHSIHSFNIIIKYDPLLFLRKPKTYIVYTLVLFSQKKNETKYWFLNYHHHYHSTIFDGFFLLFLVWRIFECAFGTRTNENSCRQIGTTLIKSIFKKCNVKKTEMEKFNLIVKSILVSKIFVSRRLCLCKTMTMTIMITSKKWLIFSS